MGQGSINSYTPPPATIDGIAKAMDAVSRFYGIDTSKQQARLAQLQAQAAEANLPAEQAKAQFNTKLYNDYNNSQQSPLAADAAANANGGQTKTPLQSAMLPPEIMGLQEKAAQMEKLKTETAIAKNTLGAQPQKISDEATKLAAETGKAKNELAAQPGELQTKKMAPITTGVKEFNELVKEPKQNISAYDSVYKGIKSGNIEQEQAALAQLPMVQLGIKRMNESTAATSESQRLADQLASQLSIAKTGHQSPKTIDIISRAALISKTNELNTLNSAADSFAPQLSSTSGVPADEIKNKHLLPGHKYTPDVLGYANKYGISADEALHIKEKNGGK